MMQQKNNSGGDGGDDGDVKKKKEGDQSSKKKNPEQNEKKKNHQKKSGARQAQGSGNPLEIQGVCSTQVGSRIWLAVSREDKTLSLYSIIPPQPQPDQNKVVKGKEEPSITATKSLFPTITYNLPKRARCLAFCNVSPSSSGGENCPVIVAGDLSGDAIAFHVPSVPSSDASSTDDVDAKPITTPTTRRLLLGHTASMLTGLNVVPTTTALDKKGVQQQQLILTADRDEKIRVSYFPATHIIHGYLLGHTSFISAMDAAVSSGNEGGQRSLCITGSGDGTVRLWDYQSCKEVGMVPVVIKKCEEEEDEKMGRGELATEGEKSTEEREEEEEDVGAEDNFDEDFTDDEQSFDGHAIAVPLSVALGSDARHVVVARDGVPSIDIHPIPSPPSSKSSASSSLSLSHLVSLHKKQTLECPSQPLAVRSFSDGSVLVLAREPDFLLHFQREEGTTEFKHVSSTSSFSMALRAAVEDETIVMPETTLERDGEGQFTLQKNKVHDGDFANGPAAESAGDKPKESGPHWNDGKRKETAKLAESRRRKRRRDEAKKEKVDGSESLKVASNADDGNSQD